MSDSALDAKFLELAEGVLPAAQARRVIELCRSVETLPGAAEIAVNCAARTLFYKNLNPSPILEQDRHAGLVLSKRGISGGRDAIAHRRDRRIVNLRVAKLAFAGMPSAITTAAA